MAGVLDTVNQRTQLVGQNRMELLLFKMEGKQCYGINVFKVKEVIRCLPLTVVPQSSPKVRGLAHIRGVTIPVIDLSMAIGGLSVVNPHLCYIIITEYNQTVQGFLVRTVEKIINIKWEAIHSPPAGINGHKGSYLTAVTQVDEALIEIIDVEQVLQEISPVSTILSEHIKNGNYSAGAHSRMVVVDDSAVARSQIKKTMDQLGLECMMCCNGREGLALLKKMSTEGPNIYEKFLAIISDVEMPEMDGYTLTTELRADPLLKDAFIVLHTSLSGVFNKALIERVGANKFIAKFQTDALAEMIKERIADRAKNGK